MGFQKAKWRLQFRHCKRRGWSRLQVLSISSQRKAHWAAGLTWESPLPLLVLLPSHYNLQWPLGAGDWHQTWVGVGQTVTMPVMEVRRTQVERAHKGHICSRHFWTIGHLHIGCV